MTDQCKFIGLVIILFVIGSVFRYINEIANIIQDPPLFGNEITLFFIIFGDFSLMISAAAIAVILGYTYQVKQFKIKSVLNNVTTTNAIKKNKIPWCMLIFGILLLLGGFILQYQTLNNTVDFDYEQRENISKTEQKDQLYEINKNHVLSNISIVTGAIFIIFVLIVYAMIRKD